MKNTGTEAQAFTDGLQRAARPAGCRVHGADTGAGVVVNEGSGHCGTSSSPGHTMTGKIVYDIP